MQKRLILDICNADPDLSLDTVLSNQQICTAKYYSKQLGAQMLLWAKCYWLLYGISHL